MVMLAVYRLICLVVAHLYIIVASFPGTSRGGGERAWYTLRAHAPGLHGN